MTTQSSWWDRTRVGSKIGESGNVASTVQLANKRIGFDKLYGLVDKLGPPVNKLSNKLGSEAFWPTTLDKESDKAARILRSFCSE